MKVTVIDSQKQKSIICSFADAARLIGVCSKTVSRWSFDRKMETYNQFTLYFHTIIKKQPVRNKCPLK